MSRQSRRGRDESGPTSLPGRYRGSDMALQNLLDYAAQVGASVEIVVTLPSGAVASPLSAAALPNEVSLAEHGSCDR